MAIFLSYSRHDETTVKTLVRGLEAARRQVWYDHVLGAGDAWWAEILENIRDASVFVFGLSDASLSSKPCLAELGYARTLGRPILPVQVGPLLGMRANPLSELHTVVYRPDDAPSGFEVFAAVESLARHSVPLPEPLPPEPSIPYAYLKALSTQIGAAELDAATQETVLDQLRKALGDESEPSVRDEVLGMVRALKDKPWVTRRTERDAAAMLIAHSAQTGPAPSGPAPTPGSPAPETTTPPPADPPEPDGRAIFEKRMEEIAERKRADERRRADEQRQRQMWEPPTPQRADQPVVTGGPPTWIGVPTPAPEPASTGQATQAQATPGQAPPTSSPRYAPGHSEPAPPNWWALSIVAFVFSILLGGIAMYFSYQVGQLYEARDYEGARKASRTAKAWGIAGAVFGGVVLIIAFSPGGA